MNILQSRIRCVVVAASWRIGRSGGRAAGQFAGGLCHGPAGFADGLLVAWGMGAPEPAIRSGAFGFNAVLAAIALGGVFFVLDAASIVYAVLAAITTTIVFAATSAALQPVEMPALTFPFVLVVWPFVLASSYFPRLRPVAAA